MVLKLSSIKADLSKERDGDWISHREPDWDESVRFKVRSIHSPQYREAYDAFLLNPINLSASAVVGCCVGPENPGISLPHRSWYSGSPL